MLARVRVNLYGSGRLVSLSVEDHFPTPPRPPDPATLNRPRDVEGPGAAANSPGPWPTPRGGADDDEAYGLDRMAHLDGVRRAHRVVFTLLVGPIPDGDHLHHKCHNRLRVNPAHLERMSQAEHARTHVRDRQSVAALLERIT